MGTTPPPSQTAVIPSGIGVRRDPWLLTFWCRESRTSGISEASRAGAEYCCISRDRRDPHNCSFPGASSKRLIPDKSLVGKGFYWVSTSYRKSGFDHLNWWGLNVGLIREPSILNFPRQKERIFIFEVDFLKGTIGNDYRQRSTSHLERRPNLYPEQVRPPECSPSPSFQLPFPSEVGAGTTSILLNLMMSF
jgi:hypothetical protein